MRVSLVRRASVSSALGSAAVAEFLWAYEDCSASSARVGASARAVGEERDWCPLFDAVACAVILHRAVVGEAHMDAEFCESIAAVMA